MDRFSEDRFHDENAARAFLEGVLWPDGPICVHCGVVNHAYPQQDGRAFTAVRNPRAAKISP